MSNYGIDKMVTNMVTYGNHIGYHILKVSCRRL